MLLGASKVIYVVETYGFQSNLARGKKSNISGRVFVHSSIINRLKPLRLLLASRDVPNPTNIDSSALFKFEHFKHGAEYDA